MSVTDIYLPCDLRIYPESLNNVEDALQPISKD